MKLIKRHIFFILFSGLLLSACEKDEDQSEGATAISQIKILAEANVVNAITVVAGDGVYLLVYTNIELEYAAKLMTNEGVELWTKNISEELSLIPSEATLTIEEVLYDIDGTFAFFSGQRLVKLDVQGNVVYDNPTFTTGIPDGNNQALILNVFGTSDGGYFVSGSFRQNVNNRFRAYFTKYSRTGIVEFSELYFINTAGDMGITSGIENENGYTLGGYYSSRSVENKTAFYILNISAEGEILWSQIHETALVIGQPSVNEILGREIIQLANGNMIYFMVPQENAFSDQRSKGFVVDAFGALVDSVFFDLANSNMLASSRPSIGQGVVKSNDGGFVGIANPRFIIDQEVSSTTVPLNYETPSFGYSFSIGAFGAIEEMKFIDQSLSMNLASITTLSNSGTVIFGLRQSIDNEVKLITITNEAN